MITIFLISYLGDRNIVLIGVACFVVAAKLLILFTTSAILVPNRGPYEAFGSGGL
jgi:hypothetical protein